MAEDRESRRIWWVAGGILALLAAWRLLPEVDNPLAPEPVAAHVAILAATVAFVGLEASLGFLLPERGRAIAVERDLAFEAIELEQPCNLGLADLVRA